MDRKVRLAQGTARHRTFRYRAPDPTWAPRDHIESVRRSLRAFDPRVALWWGSGRGRWRLMEWLNGQGIWSHIAFWQGPNGEYRHPEAGSMKALLVRLSGLDEKAIAGFEEDNQKLEIARRDELRSPSMEYLRDIASRAVGGKIVVGSGAPRSRNWLQKEATGHHRKFVTEHLTRRWEERNGRRWEGGS